MNTKKILRLPINERENYIRSELTKEKRFTLVHYLSSYGFQAKEMSKEDLIEMLVGILMAWASNMDLDCERRQDNVIGGRIWEQLHRIT